MIPTDPDRGASPLPSPNGLGGSEDPEATAAYPPVGGPPPASARSGCQSASPRRFDFLGPPRAEGELGWLAHYRVRSLVGEGGIGLVFRAEDTQLSRPVALKVIRPEMAGAPGVRARFVREAQATAAIKHDHIVTIYQVGRDNDILFLAMEYLQGMSLQSWLERGRKPSMDLVLRIGREIAAGLAAAHRRGLIHRDIKPANIWLEAPSGRVKILDFGMARSERDDVQITHSGTVVGTPAYMAPEQARGEAVGAGSDLFSLGCVLYRLCTGRLPFEGETIMAVLSALSIGHSPLAPPDRARRAAGARRAGDATAGQGPGGTGRRRPRRSSRRSRRSNASCWRSGRRSNSWTSHRCRQDVAAMKLAECRRRRRAGPACAGGAVSRRPSSPMDRGGVCWRLPRPAAVGFRLVPTGKSLPVTVAGHPASVPASDEPSASGKSCRRSRRVQSRRNPKPPLSITLRKRSDASVRSSNSPLPSGESMVTAPTVPGRAPGGAETVDRPSRRSTDSAVESSKERKTGDAPPQLERSRAEEITRRVDESGSRAGRLGRSRRPRWRLQNRTGPDRRTGSGSLSRARRIS